MKVKYPFNQLLVTGASLPSRFIASSMVLGAFFLVSCSTDTQAPLGDNTASQTDEVVHVLPMQSGYMPVELTYNCGPNRREHYGKIAHATHPIRSMPPALRQELEFEGKPLQLDKRVCYRIHTQDGGLRRITSTRCESVTFRYEDHRYLFPDRNVLYGTLQELADWEVPLGEDLLGVEFDATEHVTFHQGHPLAVRWVTCLGQTPPDLNVDTEARQFIATFPEMECRDNELRFSAVVIRNIDYIVGGATEVKWEGSELVDGSEVTREGTEVVGDDDHEYGWDGGGLLDDSSFTPLSVSLTFSGVTESQFTGLASYTHVSHHCSYQDGWL